MNEQDTVGDSRLRPRCRQATNSTKQRCLTSGWCCHLAKWTKHARRLSILFGLLCANITSSTNRKFVAHRIVAGVRGGQSNGHRWHV